MLSRHNMPTVPEILIRIWTHKRLLILGILFLVYLLIEHSSYGLQAR